MGDNDGLWGLLAGVVIGVGITAGAMCLKQRNEADAYNGWEVRTGYVNPAEMAIKMRDFYCDGKGVPVIQYKGKAFLLKDERGRPVAKDYDVIEKQIQQERQ